MPGPKYVKDFEFPESFGFSGSATDRMTTSVRAYERAKPRFAEGGQVKDPPPKTPPPKQPPTTPKVETGKASLVDIMKGKTRRQQEAELGLKKGGRAKPKYKKGGPIVTKGKEPGHATQPRTEPTNNLDQEAGGRGPLRPGFKKGGMRGPMCKAMGGPVTAAKGGMKKVADAEIAKHVAAPKPRGHGIKR